MFLGVEQHGIVVFVLLSHLLFVVLSVYACVCFKVLHVYVKSNSSWERSILLIFSPFTVFILLHEHVFYSLKNLRVNTLMNTLIMMKMLFAGCLDFRMPDFES